MPSLLKRRHFFWAPYMYLLYNIYFKIKLMSACIDSLLPIYYLRVSLGRTSFFKTSLSNEIINSRITLFNAILLLKGEYSYMF